MIEGNHKLCRGYGRETLKEQSVKRNTKRPKPTGANADGGTIEKGQSRDAHAKARSSVTGKTGDGEWLDETERDTPDRQKTRDALTKPTKSNPPRKR